MLALTILAWRRRLPEAKEPFGRHRMNNLTMPGSGHRWPGAFYRRGRLLLSMLPCVVTNLQRDWCNLRCRRAAVSCRRRLSVRPGGLPANLFLGSPALATSVSIRTTPLSAIGHALRRLPSTCTIQLASINGFVDRPYLRSHVTVSATRPHRPAITAAVRTRRSAPAAIRVGHKDQNGTFRGNNANLDRPPRLAGARRCP